MLDAPFTDDFYELLDSNFFLLFILLVPTYLGIYTLNLPIGAFNNKCGLKKLGLPLKKAKEILLLWFTFLFLYQKK